MRKVLGRLNSWLLGEKRKRYLCAMQTPPPPSWLEDENKRLTYAQPALK